MRKLDGLKLALICLITGLFSILPIVKANEYCIDNVTKSNNITVQGVNYVWSENCVFGCDATRNTCNPDPTMQFVYIALGIFGLLIFIILLKNSGVIR